MEARPDISYGNVRGLVNVVLGIHVMFLDMNVLHYSDVTQLYVFVIIRFFRSDLNFLVMFAFK